MSSRICFVDGREVNVALSGKRVVEELANAADGYARFRSASGCALWVSVKHVALVEERAELV